MRGLPVKLVFIASAKPQFDLIAQPQIRSVADLKGKHVGISSRGGAVDLLTQLIVQKNGLVPNKEGSIAKLFSSELDVRIANTAMKVLGVYGQLRAGSPRAAASGRVESTYLYATTSTVGGGTSEIQRNIIAQRGLGMPRA